MTILDISPYYVDRSVIHEAIQCVNNGGIIAYPTDSMYALGCDALSNRAIEKLCALKGINPDKQMLSIICSDISMASEYALIDNNAFRVIKHNTPGPFTFILPVSPRLPKIFKGRKTVGIRIPDNETAKALVEELGHPLLSASIENDDSHIHPYDMVEHHANGIDILLDCDEFHPEPSTVVSLLDSTSPEIIRQGKGILD